MAGDTILEVTEVTEAITLSITEVDETITLVIQEAPQGPAGPAGTTNYNELQNVPLTFPPSAHTHAFSSLSGKPTTLDGYGITDAATSQELSDERERAQYAEGELQSQFDNHTHDTDDLTEGITNLFYTSTRVANWLLTGISFATATILTAADSLLIALGKLQAQITLRATIASPIFTGSVSTPQLIVTVSTSASASGFRITGSLFAGGTGTTTLPYQLFQPTAATAVTTWNTSGTWLGMNASSGFVGNFLDFHVNGGASVFSVSSAGNLSVTGTATFTGITSGPTAAVGTNTTQFSTTAFVQAAISNLISNAVTWLGKITASAVVVDAVELTASNIVSVTSSRALAATDNGKTLVCTGGANITLTVSNSLPSAFGCKVVSSLNTKYAVLLATSSTTINGKTRLQALPAETLTELIWRSSNSYVTTIRELSSRSNGLSQRRFLFSDDFMSLAQWYQVVSGTGYLSGTGYNASVTGAATLGTGTTANSISAIGTGISANLYLLNIQPWTYAAIFNISHNTAIRVRVGVGNMANNGLADVWGSGQFMGLEFDPSLHANFRYVSSSGGSAAYSDSTVAGISSAWVLFEMRSSGVDGSVYFSINGGAEVLLSGQYDNASGPIFAVQNTSAANRILYPEFIAIDGFANR